MTCPDTFHSKMKALTLASQWLVVGYTLSDKTSDHHYHNIQGILCPTGTNILTIVQSWIIDWTVNDSSAILVLSNSFRYKTVVLTFGPVPIEYYAIQLEFCEIKKNK